MGAKQPFDLSLPAGPDLSAVQNAFTQQAKLWWEAQSAFLVAWQAASNNWFNRRQQGLAAARDTMQAMLGCKDMGEVAVLQQKYLARSLDQMSEEARAIADDAVAATRQNSELIVQNGAALSKLAEQPVWRTGKASRATAYETASGRASEKAAAK